MIVAHPDDEDGGMLTYESRGQGARVGMLTLTRGEGGQNVVSGDFDDALGLVRTRELLAADRYFGIDQMFGTEADFGFSKTIEEAFSKWTHERVLYDAVRAVRLYRPLVVASVFIGAVTDGHGQHQVSGEIAQEVFHAAADPRIFPEMGLPAWQVRKVYARVPFATIDERGMFDYATGKYTPPLFHNYVTDTSSTTPPRASLTVPEGDVDALLGMSYVQFARQGLALQKTQIGSGMRVPPAGRFDVGYTRYGTVSGVSVEQQEKTFFDGVDTSLNGIAELAPSLASTRAVPLRTDLGRISSDVQAAQQALDAGDSRRGAAALADGTQLIDATIASVTGFDSLPERERYDLLHELRIKRAQFNDALIAWLGISLRAEVVGDAASGEPAGSGDQRSPRAAVQGQRLAVQVTTTNAGKEDLRTEDETERYAHGITIAGGAARSPAMNPLATGAVQSESLQAEIKPDAGLSRPYYTRKDSEQPFYDLLDARLRNAPVSPPALTAWQTVWFNGVPLSIGAPVTVRPRVQDAKTVRQLLTIVPAVSVAIDPRAGVVPEDQKGFEVRVAVAAEGRGSEAGSLRLELPAGWAVSPERATFRTGEQDKPQQIAFTVTPSHLMQKSYQLSAVAESGGKQYTEGFARVGYPGLVRDELYSPAHYLARGVDVSVPRGLKVAYLPGTGDAVAASLTDIGLEPVTVSVADIAAGRLAGFDALLLGVRAYAAQKDLPSITPRMLEFAAGGGVVIVQYNSAEYDHDYGPFAYKLTGSAEKVVEEKAPVQLLDPRAQVLRWPNRLTSHDFDGWVEERGHGFMQTWDPRFAAVTEVHDAGQDPQRGGLLIAPVGKGAYVYCAFALYRQLPAGVPGAFRLMANLLSLGRHPE